MAKAKGYTGERVYRKIARSVENDILDGIIREGEPVPSTNQFAEFFDINPATAAKGVSLLTERGLLFKKRGIGMFVADGAYERLLADRRAEFREQFIAPLLEEAARIGISKRDLLADIMWSEEDEE
ncbi:GntR family transcriptional regulator [Oscillospiraceae bacterium OttesenSCG-928-G22]|nr:GntR family transcriptional regulator [Oscillospiraceae bacterium OttesenSCG-928-G22]